MDAYKWADEFAPLDMIADEGLLDLLCEDGLLSPAQARKEYSPAQLLSLLRRIFGSARHALPRPAGHACVPAAHSDAPPSLRAPPAAA